MEPTVITIFIPVILIHFITCNHSSP
jgi:hypothetical protein